MYLKLFIQSLYIEGFGSYFHKSVKENTYIRLHISEDHKFLSQLFHDGGPYHTETSLLICRANQWIDFYVIVISAMKDLKCFNYVFSQ